MREVLRYYHYAYRTEQTYCQWIRRYIYFYGGQTHPGRLGSQDVERFLSDLAARGKVSASTQRQALNALVFLYRQVLDQPLEGKIAPLRGKRKPKVPTMLGKTEIGRFFRHIHGIHTMLENGVHLRMLQELMGHADIKTTEMYLHVMD